MRVPAAPHRTAVPERARRHGPVVAALVAVLAAGLATSRGTGLAADVAGGVLYAALVHLLVLLVAPRVRAAIAAGAALGWCVAVELFQLTPVPALVGAAWPPAAYVLGSTFVATDLLAYTGGVAVVALVDIATARRHPSPRARRVTA